MDYIGCEQVPIFKLSLATLLIIFDALFKKKLLQSNKFSKKLLQRNFSPSIIKSCKTLITRFQEPTTNLNI